MPMTTFQMLSTSSSRHGFCCRQVDACFVGSCCAVVVVDNNKDATREVLWQVGNP